MRDFLILAAPGFVRSQGDDDAGTDGDSAFVRAAPALARCLRPLRHPLNERRAVFRCGPWPSRTRRGGAGHADDHVPPAGVGSLAPERASWPEPRDVVGFPLTVRFEYRGGPAYGRSRRRALRPAPEASPGMGAGSWHRAGGAAGRAHPAIVWGHQGQRRRERLLRHRARGRLSRPLAPHAGRLSRERRGACLPPLREPSALSQVGSGRVGCEAQGDHNGGGRQAQRGISADASVGNVSARPFVRTIPGQKSCRYPALAIRSPCLVANHRDQLAIGRSPARSHARVRDRPDSG